MKTERGLHPMVSPASRPQLQLVDPPLRAHLPLCLVLSKYEYFEKGLRLLLSGLQMAWDLHFESDFPLIQLITSNEFPYTCTLSNPFSTDNFLRHLNAINSVVLATGTGIGRLISWKGCVIQQNTWRNSKSWYLCSKLVLFHHFCFCEF